MFRLLYNPAKRSTCFFVAFLGLSTRALLRGDDCYSNRELNNECKYARAYGDASHGDSMGYFMVPFAVCNDSAKGSEFMRIVLEPSRGEWFGFSTRGSNLDLESWFCSDSVNSVQNWTDLKMNVDPQADGRITDICLALGTSALNYVDIPMDWDCLSDLNCSNCDPKTNCAVGSRGFNLGFIVFSTAVNNGYPFLADLSDFKTNIWHFPKEIDPNGQKELAAKFFDTLHPPYVPISGVSAFTCESPLADAAVVVIQLLVEEVEDPS